MPIKLVGGKVEEKAEKEAVKINQVIDWIPIPIIDYINQFICASAPNKLSVASTLIELLPRRPWED